MNTTLFNKSLSNISSRMDESSYFITDEIQLYLDISKFLWTVVSPLLLCFGIVGGVLTLMILWKFRFWNERSKALIPVFVLTITDMVVLCTGLSRYWVIQALDFDLRIVSNFGCQLNMFVIYASMQYSSWDLVVITLERFVKTNFTLKYITFVTRGRIILTLLVVFLVIAGVNCHFFWTHALVKGNQTTQCQVANKRFESFDNLFTKIDLFLLSIIPFMIMAILNIFIMRSFRSARNFRRQSVASSAVQMRLSTADNRITKMMLFTSAYFLICTLPISTMFLLNAYVFDTAEDEELDLLTVAKVQLVGTIAYLLQYTNYVMNFVFYSLFNLRFRRRLAQLCCHSHFRFRRDRSKTYNLRSTSESTSDTASTSVRSTRISINSVSSQI